MAASAVVVVRKKQHVEKQITSGRERESESIKCWRREKGQNDKTQNAHKTFCQYICVHQEENYLKKQEIQIK